MIEFTKIRMDHIHWAEQITNALKKGKLPEVNTFRDCEFGQWLHSEGMKKYGNITEMSELEEKHVSFHSTVAEMVKYIKTRDYDNAEILLGEFRRESKELIYLLSLVEYRLKNSPLY